MVSWRTDMHARTHMHTCACAEVVEVACGIAPMLAGELVENVASGIDCYSIRQPLGVGRSSTCMHHARVFIR